MKKMLWSFLLIVCITVFVFSGVKIYRTYHASAQSTRLNRELANIAVTMANSEILLETEGVPVDAQTEIEAAPLSVDFSALKERNPDIIAWLYCADTPINLPVAQSSDNQYYLHRLLDGSYNYKGTLFLDYRDSENFSNFTSIIYGHSMKDGTMFGTLLDYTTQEYYEAHPTWYLLTPEQSYRVDLVAGYRTELTSETYLAEYSPEEKAAFLSFAMKNSTFVSDVTASTDDLFLILSTCSYEFEGARYVLVGKLTEIADLQLAGS